MKFLAYSLEEPITKQYLDNCPKNASCISNTSAESTVNLMHFYFETATLT